ncbi:MAG: HAMP domain-containing sensor histidine kinase [Candidatus Andersenbacteria bacterium]
MSRNMDKKIKTRKTRQLVFIGASIALTSIAVAILASGILYQRTVVLLQDNLRERLLSISITEAANIDPKDLSALNVQEDWQKPEWARVVNSLHRAKYSNQDVVFMYIFRKTSIDPTQMEFVADADSIDPFANTSDDPSRYVDVNRDGKVEPDGPDKLQWPGQGYPEASDIPEAFSAYSGPLTNKDLYTDDYGTVLTGYAPIIDENGNTVAILGTDVKANDFFSITRQTLYPFLAFIGFLVLVILALITLLIVFIVRALRKEIAQSQEIEELIKARSEFLYVASHQLRTPVSLITGTLSMLEEGDLDKIPAEKKKMMMSGLFHKSKKLTNIVNDILTASEMDIVAFKLAQGDLLPINLRAITKSICDDLQEKAAAKKIKLEYQGIDIGAPITILASSHYLEHAISNVIDNAIKYTNEGFVRIGLRETNDKAVLTVSDTGIGIPIAEQPRIFEKFKRASNAIKAYADGSGLGLFIVKKIIESHPGGSIRFVSEGENKGTTFTLEFSKAERK